MEKVIQITSKREGFRRCGIAHSETTTSYPLDRFTKDELERLQNEPMLIVHITEPTNNAKNDELAELNANVQALYQDVLDGQSKNDELTQKLADALRENNDLQAQLVAGTKALTDAEAEIARLNAELTALKTPESDKPGAKAK
ncbi:HI1506-related protein [Limnobaculum zhutongyuii]|uniref:HI1506-related protein n=1 Tax=Limnobaculum zhutongyuii TaxID=2498113 RepID=UPI00143D4A8E|nr:HI1506-related protein [Limnobaculum zhutongyuii]